MSAANAPTDELALYLADTTLAAGLQYGLWVERSPSTEEQVAMSSMSQDKLGHARAFLQKAEKVTGRSSVELTYDRDPDAFAWNPAWVAPLETWEHVVLAQVLFGRALMEELRALSETSPLSDPLEKIEQEERWHTRHGDAWLDRAAEGSGDLAAAFEEIWPFAVGFFGAEGTERFPEDLDSGVRTRSDDELRQGFLDDVVPRLEDAGLDVPADRDREAWATRPEPTDELVDDLTERIASNAVELAGLLQDPEGRELAEMT